MENAKEYLGVGLTPKDILKLYNKYENFRAIKGESSSVFMQNEIKTYPKNLRVFNGRGGQEIVDNFLSEEVYKNFDSSMQLQRSSQHVENDEFHPEVAQKPGSVKNLYFGFAGQLGPERRLRV